MTTFRILKGAWPVDAQHGVDGVYRSCYQSGTGLNRATRLVAPGARPALRADAVTVANLELAYRAWRGVRPDDRVEVIVFSKHQHGTDEEYEVRAVLVLPEALKECESWTAWRRGIRDDHPYGDTAPWTARATFGGFEPGRVTLTEALEVLPRWASAEAEVADDEVQRVRYLYGENYWVATREVGDYPGEVYYDLRPEGEPVRIVVRCHTVALWPDHGVWAARGVVGRLGQAVPWEAWRFREEINEALRPHGLILVPRHGRLILNRLARGIQA